MVKILHTGDLHLDSAFSSLSISESENAREESRKTFKKMMDYAKENSYDMVLISGDLFDAKYITTATRELVKKCFADVGCPVIIAPGNHDPYPTVPLYREGELSDNVYIFSSEEMQVFDFDELGVSVCGYAFMSERMNVSPLESFTRPDTDNTLILCAHADVASPTSKYAPISARLIDSFDFAYAALGHIHNPPEITSRNTLIRYCGFPTGRSFDELGDGGALSVTIEDNEATAERIIFSSHRFLEDTLDISDAETASEIESKITEYAREAEYGEDTSLSLTLTGSVSFELVIDTEELSKTKTALRTLKIKNDTLPVLSGESLAKDITLRGELYRTLLPKLESEDPAERRTAAAALRIGLFAIDGKNLSDIISVD